MNSIAISPNNQILASVYRDYPDKIYLWNISNGSLTHTFTRNRASYVSIAFSPDSKILASGTGNGTVELWDVSTGQQIRTLRHFEVKEDPNDGSSVSSVVFSPDGETIASSGIFYRDFNEPQGGTVKLWDVSTGKELHTFTIDYQIYSIDIAISPDGQTLGIASSDGTIKLYSDGTIKLYNLASQQEKYTLKVNYWPAFFAFGLDNTLFVSGGYLNNNTLTLSVIDANEDLLSITLVDPDFSNLTVTPDGQFLVSGSDQINSGSDQIRLWRIPKF